MKIILVILILSFGLTGVANADGLVPCGGGDEAPCTICDIFALISKITNFIATRFAPIVGALLFVYGGIMMIVSVGNPGKFQEAKKIFWSTIVGLVIIYGAWLVTNSLMKALAGENDISDTWNQIECSSGSSGGGDSDGGGTFPIGE